MLRAEFQEPVRLLGVNSEETKLSRRDVLVGIAVVGALVLPTLPTSSQAATLIQRRCGRRGVRLFSEHWRCLIASSQRSYRCRDDVCGKTPTFKVKAGRVVFR
jgi:hypothetical protein